MSSTATPASTRPLDAPRPVLALICGLLGLPGCTIAWELPAGGFWIGLPLAAAAIVLGLRARSQVAGRQRWMALAAIVLGVAEILFMATWTVVA